MEWLITLATAWIAIQLAGFVLVAAILVTISVLALKGRNKAQRRFDEHRAAFTRRYNGNPPYTC